MFYSGKNVTILGAGRSGLATALYLAKRGAQVTVSELSILAFDKDPVLADLKSRGVKFETGAHSDEAIAGADLILTSPGIKPDAEVMVRARKHNKEVVSDIEIAYREAKVPIIAITGTNGKSTTCALISHILTEAGHKAPACGNIGVPILAELEKNPDFLVVEVSSYQITYSPTFAPQVSIWLNMTPDHLDWHGGMNGYIEAKRKLFANQKPGQFAVLNIDDPIVADTKTQATVFPFSVSSAISTDGAYLVGDKLAYRLKGTEQLLCRFGELKIIGQHNLENVLSAISACALVGLPAKDIEKHVKSFTALEHRLEYVADIEGVAYYNDSKATNTASAIKALEAFGNEKVVLIAGGRDKGTDLGEFVDSIKKHVSNVILIGEAKDRFEEALKAGGYTKCHKVDSMEAAVELGGRLRQGAVLLSPACASFDMFKDYEDRGRVFKDIVRTRLKIKTPSS
ncbi:MAG: UDP-N-acetylmuramoyl-L-alanine--D-glutamate ligase [Candidatus Obscuribacterales bacterium]|nr:UDP-N-acetylmuramoyl-L-alanine--D-glutamate ligase [Candidatus Obscuribacterales bacterium]